MHRHDAAARQRDSRKSRQNSWADHTGGQTSAQGRRGGGPDDESGDPTPPRGGSRRGGGGGGGGGLVQHVHSPTADFGEDVTGDELAAVETFELESDDSGDDESLDGPHPPPPPRPHAGSGFNAKTHSVRDPSLGGGRTLAPLSPPAPAAAVSLVPPPPSLASAPLSRTFSCPFSRRSSLPALSQPSPNLPPIPPPPPQVLSAVSDKGRERERQSPSFVDAACEPASLRARTMASGPRVPGGPLPDLAAMLSSDEEVDDEYELALGARPPPTKGGGAGGSASSATCQDVARLARATEEPTRAAGPPPRGGAASRHAACGVPAEASVAGSCWQRSAGASAEGRAAPSDGDMPWLRALPDGGLYAEEQPPRGAYDDDEELAAPRPPRAARDELPRDDDARAYSRPHDDGGGREDDDSAREYGYEDESSGRDERAGRGYGDRAYDEYDDQERKSGQRRRRSRDHDGRYDRGGREEEGGGYEEEGLLPPDEPDNAEASGELGASGEVERELRRMEQLQLRPDSGFVDDDWDDD